MLPCHWGTFKLTDEPIDEPPRELRRAVEAAGGRLDPIHIMAIGEQWEVPKEGKNGVTTLATSVPSSLSESSTPGP